MNQAWIWKEGTGCTIVSWSLGRHHFRRQNRAALARIFLTFFMAKAFIRIALKIALRGYNFLLEPSQLKFERKILVKQNCTFSILPLCFEPIGWWPLFCRGSKREKVGFVGTLILSARRQIRNEQERSFYISSEWKARSLSHTEARRTRVKKTVWTFARNRQQVVTIWHLDLGKFWPLIIYNFFNE